MQNMQSSDSPAAVAYLENLLNNGSKEGDSGAAFNFPPYYDEQLFRKGQSYISKYRYMITSNMVCGLFAGQVLQASVAILKCTGQSSTPAAAYQRYMRTIWHVASWYECSPHDKNSKFWNSIRAVRKIHTRSSHACAKLGVGRITQAELAFTQFTFIGLLFVSAHRVQLYDEDFHEATSHMWRVIGYWLGIKDKYNACGSNWRETHERMQIMRKQVFTPNHKQVVHKDVELLSRAICEGLRALSPLITLELVVFLARRLLYCKGYEYFDFDVEPGTQLDAQQRRYYKDLGWQDRIVLAFTMYTTTYLHKYAVFRWLINFSIWLQLKMAYYLPIRAVWKYGFKRAYVRVFNKAGNVNEYEFHMKQS